MSFLQESSSSLTSLAVDNEKLFACIAGGIIVFLIYILKTHSVEKQNHETGAKRATLVKYTIPWLGSAMELGKDPDDVFRKAVKAFGPIFRMYAAGREFTYVAAPDLISTIYRDPKKYHYPTSRLELVEKVFGGSHELCQDPAFSGDLFKAQHEALSSANIGSILLRYSKSVHESLQGTIDKMKISSDGKTVTTGLAFLTRWPAYDASSYAFFGKAFTPSETYDSFSTFDDGLILLQTNLPRFVVKKTLRAREKLIKVFEKYLSSPHDDCSELIRVIEQVSDKTNWSVRDKAVILAGDFWAIQSNAPTAVYWLLALQLQRPEGLTNLLREIDMARTEWFRNNNDQTCHDDSESDDFQWILDSPLPLLTSTIHETLRFVSFSFSIRMVMDDTVLGGYYIPRGDYVICNTRLVHMDEDVHENCKDFVPDRYLKNTKFVKEGRSVPNHSMYFGGGISMCEGRHFALGELKIFIALLLTLLTIEVDPTSSERPRFNLGHIGTGVVPPIGDLSVRVTKRTL